MKAAIKRSFYLDPQIEEVLAKAPPKKVSERANELMRKGLQKEKEEAKAAEYKRCADELAKRGSDRDEDEISSSALSYRLFQDDDSADEDLI